MENWKLITIFDQHNTEWNLYFWVFMTDVFLKKIAGYKFQAATMWITIAGMFQKWHFGFAVKQLELFYSSRRSLGRKPTPVVAVAKVTEQGFTNRTEIKLCGLIDFLQPGACIIKRNGFEKLVFEISELSNCKNVFSSHLHHILL